MISRRALLVGGATVAGLTVTGRLALKRSVERSAPAFLPWNEARESLDVWGRLAGWARLAPSFRNMQPWRLRRVGRDGAALLADPERVHPIADPSLRQTFVSQGTFLELFNLAAAAAALKIAITLFPDGPVETLGDLDERPVAYIRLLGDAPRDSSPLFSAVRARRTTCASFDGRIVPEAAQKLLTEEARTVEGVACGWIDCNLRQERLLALIVESMRREAADAEACREAASVLRLTSAEILEHRDGLVPLPPCLGAAIRLLYGADAFADPESVLTRRGFSWAARRIGRSAAFAWLTTAGNARRDQIAAGRAYMRFDLQAARLGIALQPTTQVLSGVSEAPAREELHRLLSPEGGTVQMLARLGRAEAVPPTPRRPLSAFLPG